MQKRNLASMEQDSFSLMEGEHQRQSRACDEEMRKTEVSKEEEEREEGEDDAKVRRIRATRERGKKEERKEKEAPQAIRNEIRNPH